MAYEKLGFVDNETPLDAAHFNHMEEGITRANGVIETAGGDTLTWDGDMDGRDTLGDFTENPAYRISDITPTIDDFVDGTVNVVMKSGDTHTFLISDMGNGMLATEAMFALIVPADVEEEGIVVKKGLYFSIVGDDYITSLTIPGYTGFTNEIIKQDALPEALRFGDVMVELMPETEVTGTEDSGMYVVNLDISVITGEHEKLNVTFDGAEYSCGCTPIGEIGGVLYGNGSFFGLDDTGEPFCIAVVPASFGMLAMQDAEAHMVAISGMGVKKLDKKYLPGAALLYYDETYLYTDSDITDASKRITREQLLLLFLSGRPIRIATVGNLWFAMALNVDFGANYGYVVINTATGNGGTPKNTLLYTAEYTPTT